MAALDKMITFLSLLALVECNPFDDGKYNPIKYKILDDGKYYRPLTEGKYVPGDEGRYTYVYKQGLYPIDDRDYRYVHQAGPDGRLGRNGDSTDINIRGDESNKIEYIGHKTYAGRYPYIHKVIKALADEYVSTDSLFGEKFGSSVNHYNKVQGENEVALKCQPLNPFKLGGKQSDFVTQYPPRSQIADGENVGSFYTFKGTKTISTLSTPLFTTKLKLQYEVFIRVLDEITEIKDEDYIQQEKYDINSNVKEPKPKTQNNQRSDVPLPIQNIFDTFVLQTGKSVIPNAITKQSRYKENKQNIILQNKFSIEDPKPEIVTDKNKFHIYKSDANVLDEKYQPLKDNEDKVNVEKNKNDLRSNKNHVILINKTTTEEPSKEIELPYTQIIEETENTTSLSIEKNTFTSVTEDEQITEKPITENNKTSKSTTAPSITNIYNVKQPDNNAFKESDLEIVSKLEPINVNDDNKRREELEPLDATKLPQRRMKKK